MHHQTITLPTDAEIQAFLPIDRARGACFVTNTTQDSRILDYTRSALSRGEDVAGASLLPQTRKAIVRTPAHRSSGLGLECRIDDPDNAMGAWLIPRGPVIEIVSVTMLDASGAAKEVVDPSKYRVEVDRFLKWNEDFSLPSQACQRPTFEVVYRAGHTTEHPTIGELRIAVEETLAAMWNARGGTFTMPSTAARTFRALRKSRTYSPGTPTHSNFPF